MELSDGPLYSNLGNTYTIRPRSRTDLNPLREETARERIQEGKALEHVLFNDHSDAVAMYYHSESYRNHSIPRELI